MQTIDSIDFSVLFRYQPIPPAQLPEDNIWYFILFYVYVQIKITNPQIDQFV